MLSRSALSTFVLSFALVALAEVTPLAPGPGDIFQQGGTCTISWNPDATGTWTTLNIELMTGDNFNMVHLTTVATVDGTTSPGAFSYPCPAVTPSAPIYFYQFSTPSAPTTTTWTGRFTIADSTGNTVPAPNQKQPDGEPIPWGTGALTDPSTAKPAPPYLHGGNTTSPGTGSNSTSAAPSSSMMVLSPTSSAVPSSFFAGAGTSTRQAAFDTGSDSAAGATSTGTGTSSSGSSSGGALALGTVSARAAQAGVALAVIAGTFTFLV